MPAVAVPLQNSDGQSLARMPSHASSRLKSMLPRTPLRGTNGAAEPLMPGCLSVPPPPLRHRAHVCASLSGAKVPARYINATDVCTASSASSQACSDPDLFAAFRCTPCDQCSWPGLLLSRSQMAFREGTRTNEACFQFLGELGSGNFGEHIPAPKTLVLQLPPHIAPSLGLCLGVRAYRRNRSADARPSFAEACCCQGA